jgi:hypothetical protein
MKKSLEVLLSLMPVWFGLFFLGPVISEIVTLATGVPAFVLVPSIGEVLYLHIFMLLGGLWGGLAILRRRWI